MVLFPPQVHHVLKNNYRYSRQRCPHPHRLLTPTHATSFCKSCLSVGRKFDRQRSTLSCWSKCSTLSFSHKKLDLTETKQKDAAVICVFFFYLPDETHINLFYLRIYSWKKKTTKSKQEKCYLLFRQIQPKVWFCPLKLWEHSCKPPFYWYRISQQQLS